MNPIIHTTHAKITRVTNRGADFFQNHSFACMTLNGKTPAEACGITVEGKNKWKTLIQNASRNETD